MTPGSTVLLGISLKMYFDHRRTMQWASDLRSIVDQSTAVRSGGARVVIFPSFTSIPAVVEIFRGSPVAVGAQNVAVQQYGAFTGEVSAVQLQQIGCRYVEIGHAERRRLFGESVGDIHSKVTAAFDAGLEPWLCVGEQERGSAASAADTCTTFLDGVFGADGRVPSRITLAYEPVWAIGASDPAGTSYIAEVASRLRGWLETRAAGTGSAVIYGGSARPGLLSELGSSVSGLFLGRFAHDPDAVKQILDEVHASAGEQGMELRS